MAGFDETLMDMMGERRLTGRVEVDWTAAVYAVRSRRIWVADVCDVGPTGLSFRTPVPLNGGDELELGLRDLHGAHAQVIGCSVHKSRSLDHRVGIVLNHVPSEYIDMVIGAFQAEIDSATRSERRVDFGLADVMPLPVERKSAQVGNWQARELGRVIPYRRASAAGGLLGGRRGYG